MSRIRNHAHRAPGLVALGIPVAALAALSSAWLARGAAAPVRSGAPAAIGATVSVERSGEDQVDLLVRLPGEPVMASSGGTAVSVRFAGGTPPTGPGMPDLDQVVCEIGLGRSGPVTVDAVPVDEVLVPLDGEIARIPYTFTGSGQAIPEDGEVRTASSDAAGAMLPLASVGGAGEFRGLRIAGIVVRPVRYDPARHAIRISHVVRVSVRVVASATARDAGAAGFRGGRFARPAAARGGFGADDPFLAASVLNWDSARAWRAGPGPMRARPLGTGEYFDASPNWLKIDITGTGLYEIRYQDLAAAGVVPEQIEPGTLRLFNGGGLVVPESLEVPRRTWMDECAIEVHADTAGVFGPGSLIRFYALGSGGYRAEYDPAQPWTYFEHPYSPKNIYWLTWQEAGNPPSGFSTPPRRIASRVTADSLGSPATRDSTFTEHLHYEQNLIENFRTPAADGWYWTSFALLGRTKRFTAYHPDAVVSAPARVRVSLVGWADPEDTGTHYHSARVAVDDPDLATRVVGWRQWNDENEAVVDSAGPWLAAEPETSLIWISVAAGDSCAYPPVPPDTTCHGYFDRDIYLNSIDLFYARRLRAHANELRFAAPDSAAGAIELVVPGFTDVTGLTVWDITDPANVASMDERAVTGSAGDFTLTVRDTIGAPGTLRRYFATTGAHVRHPSALALHTLPAGPEGAELLRRRTDPVDYVIVSDTRFLAAAERLAEHRSARHQTAVVTTESVMDEFGWGLMDPTALRDFADYAYTHWNGAPGDTTVHTLQYLLLLGDTNKDFLNRSGSSDPIYVPSYEGRYLLPRGSGYETDYAADDWYGYTTPNDSIPDFAIGRLPVKTAEEADRVVNRVIAYESAPEWGDWRTRVILAADDLHRPSAQYDLPGEDVHTVDTEALANTRFPPEVELVKIYETEYPLRGGKKPDASAALRRAFDDGALFINYIGHGDATRLADENLLEWNGSWDPANGNRRPVMVILSCSVGVFDAPTDGLAEILLDQPNGGLIGAFSSSFLAFVDDNRNLANAFYNRVFETHPPRPLGMAARLAKNDVIIGRSMLRAQRMERYAVLADPALELAYPADRARFGPATSDSLVRRAKAFVEGTVYDGPDSSALPVTDFNGEATLLVRATMDTSGYDYTWQSSTGELEAGHVSYSIPGPPLFWGRLSVVNGRFGEGVIPGEGEFFVAADAAAGNHGRMGVYMDDPVHGLDATGSLPDLRVSPQIAVGDSLAADSTGPTITLLEPGGSPVVAARPIPVRSLMTVVVSDPHGINASGTDPFFALAYRVDDGDWVDLTQDFRVDAGGFTTGRAEFELAASVGPGVHTLHVRAADNLNNRSEAAFELVVTAVDAVDLSYVFAYPSPFSDRTVIIYDLAQPADVDVRIYTTAGRMVRRLTETGQPGQNRTLVWDGRDEAGDPVANGVYFIKLDARELEAGGSSHHVTTRLARIR